MGSGGGGGRGGATISSQGKGGGGGGGGCGGGAVSLTASELLFLAPNARIDSSGALGGNGGDQLSTFFGNTGGDVEPPGAGMGGQAFLTNDPSSPKHGRPGAGGAGGGILLYAQGTARLDIAPSATLKTLGGGDATVNGGTVKIFCDHPATIPDTLNIDAGRTYVSIPEPAGFWWLY